LIPRDVIARLPVAIAAKYRAVPLRYEAGELHLGMADPQNFGKLDEINFALGARVRPYVVTEVALNYALERYYGLPREARLMQAAAAGMRELHAPGLARPASAPGRDQGPGSIGVAERPARLSGARPALPVYDPLYQHQGNVIDELAAVMSTDDLVQVLFRYFSDLFVEVIILAITPGQATAVQAGSRARHCETRQTPVLSLAAGTLLGAVIGKPQIIHQLAVADPEVIRLCASFAVPTSNVAFISLFNGEAPAFAVIGQGRDERYLQQAFAGLKGFVNKAGQALRIVALRNDILAA
jgi:hypothetical protein